MNVQKDEEANESPSAKKEKDTDVDEEEEKKAPYSSPEGNTPNNQFLIKTYSSNDVAVDATFELKAAKETDKKASSEDDGKKGDYDSGNKEKGDIDEDMTEEGKGDKDNKGKEVSGADQSV